MTTSYMEKEISRKKYLAPLVVIMLCAVALTGAAYAAYATSVTGNGDIQGNYVVIDMYKKTSSSNTVPEGYAPTGDLQYDVDLNANMFKVYTDTDKTSGSGTPYVAKVDSSNKTILYTYLQINTDLKNGTDEKEFSLKVPTLSLIDLSTYAGKIAIMKTEIMITLGETTQIVNIESDNTYTLKGNTLYKVMFTVAFEGGITSGTDKIFGNFATEKDVEDAVEAYNAKDVNELKVLFSASEKSSSATSDSSADDP